MRHCRWGILGTAAIAKKNWLAIKNSGNAVLTAVASRDAAKAAAWIAECQAHAAHPHPPRPLGSYEELLASDQVDAVYIPIPTGLRKEWVIKAARAGKHVLAEKPCGGNANDVREMVDACAAAGVQYMDGVMFMHSRRLDALRQSLDDGTSVGQIKRITSQFSFFGPDEFYTRDIRLDSSLEPLGCLGDLGWYNLRFTLWVMNFLQPTAVIGRVLLDHHRPGSPEPVPIEFSGELFFPGGVSAQFYCSFATEHQQWANISGTRGHIHLTDFVLPYFGAEAGFRVSNSVFHVSGCDFNMEDHTRLVAVPEYSNSAGNSQETNMIRRFSDLVLGGRPDPYWPSIALQTQQVLDACLASARQGSVLHRL